MSCLYVAHAQKSVFDLGVYFEEVQIDRGVGEIAILRPHALVATCNTFIASEWKGEGDNALKSGISGNLKAI